MRTAKRRWRRMNCSASAKAPPAGPRERRTAPTSRKESTASMLTGPATAARKSTPVSQSAMAIPPSAGITMRVPCHTMAFIATALIRCSLATRLGMRACIAGHSRPPTRPSSTAIASTCHTVTTPERSRAACSHEQRRRRHGGRHQQLCAGPRDPRALRPSRSGGLPESPWRLRAGRGRAASG